MGPALCVSFTEMAVAREWWFMSSHTPSPPHGRESKSTRLRLYWQWKETKHYHFVTYLTALKKKNNFKAGSALDFLQFSKGEGIGNSVQVRRTQTCARWLMTKLYINVRYDRLHRDGVWNANDAAHQLSVASFDLSHTPEQPLTLSW